MNALVELQPFSRQLIDEAFGSAPSSRYLAAYLDDLNATVVLTEKQYVDRHFLNDYVQFYARSFRPPPPHCERLHFFTDVSREELDGLLHKAHTSDESLSAAEQELSARYLGFVVKRPLELAAIGRTVLRTYADDAGRIFSVLRPYDANVLGLKLRVQGLAYQQQDGGAAVCASTALWSAFQQIARLSGERTPTPAEVTEAARSPFPAAHGLGDGDMARAISALGYTADRFTAANNPALFRSQVTSFLRSRYPVILLLSRGSAGQRSAGHAVTVTGYRDCSAAAVDFGGHRLAVRGAGAETIYVHDDNLGSHAHYEFSDRQHEGREELFVLRGHSTRKSPDWWQPDIWRVDGALVPKPRKVRLPIEQLQTLMVEFSKLVGTLLAHALGAAAPAFTLDAYYALGVEVLRSVTGTRYQEGDVVNWHKSHTFPRHVAVVGFSKDQDADAILFVFDATTLRQHQRGPLAILCPGLTADTSEGRVISHLAAHFRCSPLFGSRSYDLG